MYYALLNICDILVLSEPCISGRIGNVVGVQVTKKLIDLNSVWHTRRKEGDGGGESCAYPYHILSPPSCLCLLSPGNPSTREIYGS